MRSLTGFLPSEQRSLMAAADIYKALHRHAADPADGQDATRTAERRMEWLHWPGKALGFV